MSSSALGINLVPVRDETDVIRTINSWLAMPFDENDGHLPGHMLETRANHEDGVAHMSKLALEHDAAITVLKLLMRWERSCSVKPDARIGDPDPTVGHRYLDIRLQATPQRKHMGAERDFESFVMQALKDRAARLAHINADSRCLPTLEPIDFQAQTAADNLALTWRWTPEESLVTPNLHIQLTS